MCLYHGSKKLVSKLVRQKASAPFGRPNEESLNAIYLTPDFGFALACAVGPEGVTEIDYEERTIRFENPEKFNSERNVYIYFVDPSKIPDNKKIWIDTRQVAVDIDEIKPVKVERHKAGEISQYYGIIGEKG